MDDTERYTLIEKTLSGDMAAWKAFVGASWEAWIRAAGRSRSMGSLSKSEDHLRGAVTNFVERLSKHDFRSLRARGLWLQANPEKSLDDWLKIVLENAIRDYVRNELGRTNPSARKGGENVPSRKRILNEFSGSLALNSLGVRPALTLEQTAHELMRFAEGHLSASQNTCLRAWLEGASFEEIAAGATAASPEDAQKHVRSALAILRRRFGTPTE